MALLMPSFSPMRPAKLMLLLLSLLHLTWAVDFVTIQGGNFIVNGTGKRFDIIGVDYQPGGSSGFTSSADPLSDSDTCLRDAILMQQLGINTIRVYNLDANLDHSACASIFNAAGIYMILDVNSGLYGEYIDRTDPSSTYTLAYLEHVFGIIENFAPFPNTLGFWAANEILNQDSSYDAPLYIRAVVRDMKEYIANNIDRHIGVGYSAADVDTMLGDTWSYLGCTLKNSTQSGIDFFGLNDYEWCGDSSYTDSGYNKLVALFEDTSIPVFFSEYGCNNVAPRTFSNVPVLYGDEMTVMSGGLVYEYSEETDNYGLVSINSTTEVTILVDYENLSKEFASITYSTLEVLNASATALSAPSCARSLISESSFINAWDIPSAPSGAAKIISSGVSSGFVAGSMVAINTTTMPATVYNTAGATVTGLSLVELMCTDANYPGLLNGYKSSSVSCSYATATGGISGNSSSSSGGKKSDAPGAPISFHVVGMSAVVALMVPLLVWL